MFKNDGLGSDPLNVRRGQLLNVHEEGAVAVDVDDLLVRARDLCPQGRGIPVAHGAQPRAREKLAGKLELVVLSGPHLMLADSRRDNRVALGQFVQQFYDHLGENDFVGLASHVVLHVLGLQDLVGHAIRERRFRLPSLNLLVPGRELLLDGAVLYHLVQPRECILDVAFNGQLNFAVLVVLGRINIDMDDGARFAELLDFSSHAIVEPHAKRQKQVGPFNDLFRLLCWIGFRRELAADRPICIGCAVHAQPPQGERVRLREGTAAHDRAGHGDLRGFDKLAQFLARIAADDPAADIEHGTFGFFDEANDFIQGKIAGSGVGIVAAQMDFLGENGLRFGLLNVLGHIHDHRPGAAGLGNMKRLFDDAGNVVDVRDQITVLDHGKRHPKKIRLLKSALADHRLRDLPRDGHQGNGIHVGIGDAGDEVRGARAAGRHANASLARRAGIAFGREGPALLVPGENRANFFGFGQRLVEFHARAAGIRKDGIDPFAFEAGDENFAALHDRADFQSFTGSGCSGSCGFSRFAHSSFLLAESRERIKKPTTVSSRGFLSKSNLLSTSPNGAVRNYDDRYGDLSILANHWSQN